MAIADESGIMLNRSSKMYLWWMVPSLWNQKLAVWLQEISYNTLMPIYNPRWLDQGPEEPGKSWKSRLGLANTNWASSTAWGREGEGKRWVCPQLDSILKSRAQQKSIFPFRKLFSLIWPLIHQEHGTQKDAFLSDRVTSALNCPALRSQLPDSNRWWNNNKKAE